MTNRLIYLPLGGAGEIGMNCYVYGYGQKNQERYIIADVGVTFPNNDTSPGVDLIMADPSFILERKDRVDAVFITHAHEDHVGALGMLMRELGDVPVFARSFTAEIARGKMERFGQDRKQVVTVGSYPEAIDAGDFKVSFVPISHSIPEASALLIEVDGKRILHTGDFKVDRTPLVGEAFDDEMFKVIGEKGVDALICDSTNVFSTNEGRSEATLTDPIHGFLANCKGLVVATTFASNVARVRTLAQAGVRAGREVILVGRSMDNMVSTSHKTKVLSDMPKVLDAEDFDPKKRNKTLVICTGSQGEYRAASGWLSRGGYMGISMKEGDTFLFSSKVIPGNERSVGIILNDLARQGVDVVYNDDNFHVSGHANQPDLLHMQNLVKPKCVVPMHGEYRHLRKLRNLSVDAGYQSVIAPNGTMIEFNEKGVQVADEIETGRMFLDGKIMVGTADGIVRTRLHMAQNGHISVLIQVAADGKTVEPAWVMLAGLAERDIDATDIASAIEEDLDKELSKMGPKNLRDDDQIEGLVVKISKRASNSFYAKKPQITVFISRFE